MEKKKLAPPQIIEIVFDAGYLLFALAAGVFLLTKAGGSAVAALYGWMTLVLALGDSFHLVPRVYAHWTNTMAACRRALGIGKAVTSVTMTAFYMMLFYVWQLYFGVAAGGSLTVALWALAAARVALCLFPQNGWCSERPPISWAVLRNIPFAVLGAVIVCLFAGRAVAGSLFAWMPLAIFLSFVFYFIVVLFADKNRKLGMFMLPKTCMYIWIISMGFGLI